MQDSTNPDPEILLCYSPFKACYFLAANSAGINMAIKPGDWDLLLPSLQLIRN
ncbi:uncharacterized protein BDV17DRAFT_263243 [Aspergillus undulatus]|uniref:uncharacterized protein n=1 Tax=Aspergillus undulatus TaxID=1810928 RepID=UPI003CCD669C